MYWSAGDNARALDTAARRIQQSRPGVRLGIGRSTTRSYGWSDPTPAREEWGCQVSADGGRTFAAVSAETFEELVERAVAAWQGLALSASAEIRGAA